ncbi:MAP kinase kinase kinase activity protein [Marasmius sp. AFHP31]|nr:MAP kinase kinase kinase activity protein [Marasmius sp. AFHP31]
MPTASSGGVKGSTRWMAPEMYSMVMGADVEENTKEKSAKEDKSPRDVYAFACTVLEARSRNFAYRTSIDIMTGKPPFHKLLDTAVIYQVGFRRLKPERPSEGWCPDHIWNLAELCWDGDPSRRPKAKALQGYLQRLVEAGNPSPGDPSFIGYFWPDDLDLSPPTSASEIPVNDVPTAGPSQPPNHIDLYSNLPRGFIPAQLPETPHGGIPLPSPASPRDIALFFQEHEHQIDDAVMSTSFSSPSLQRCRNDEKEWIRVALDGLRKASPVFTRALDVLSGVHPALGVTVIAYKMNIASFYSHTTLTRSVVTLMVRIQETMALLLRLPKLSHPEERSTDGLTIWDRLQGLLVEITADIESAGQVIEDSFNPWSGQPEFDLDEKFIGWQHAIKHAFSYYPPSPNFETAILDAAIPRRANGRALVDQDAYTNSVVEKFRSGLGESNTPSMEGFGNGWASCGSYLDESDLGLSDFEGADSYNPLPNTTNHQDARQSQRSTGEEIDSVWQLQSLGKALALSDVTDHQIRRSRSAKFDVPVPYPFTPYDSTSRERHQPDKHTDRKRERQRRDRDRDRERDRRVKSERRDSDTSDTEGWDSDRPLEFVPMSKPPAEVYTAEWEEERRKQEARWVEKHLTHSVTSKELPWIQVHASLDYAQNDDEFVLDFTTPLFDPRQNPKPPNAPLPGGIPLVPRHTLDVAATRPAVPVMYLVFNENDFVQPCPIPPHLVLHDSSGGITVREVLKYIYDFLNQPIRRSDWDRLDNQGQRAVSTAFYKRCEDGGNMAAGTKIVDYLGKRTRFRGIEEVAAPTFKVSAKL